MKIFLVLYVCTFALALLSSCTVESVVLKPAVEDPPSKWVLRDLTYPYDTIRNPEIGKYYYDVVYDKVVKVVR